MSFLHVSQMKKQSASLDSLWKIMQNEYKVLEIMLRDLSAHFTVYIKVYVPLGMHFKTILYINQFVCTTSVRIPIKLSSTFHGYH
jgi:hypothetical protein